MPRINTPRLRRLRAKRNEILSEIRSLDQEIGKVERDLGVRSGKRRSVSPQRKPNARRMNDVTVPDAVAGLLRKSRRPMHYKDITKTLLTKGIYKTKSKNFLSTVAISIARDDRFEKVSPGVYGLRK